MLELTLRIGFSLLVVFGLMWGLARLAKRPLTRRGGATVAVLARQQLGRSASLAVVRVADRTLVLGVTDTQVNLLTEADPAAFVAAEEAPAAIREPVDLADGRASAAGASSEGSAPDGRLAGSALSPATWRQAVDFLRDRTVRR